MNNIAPEPKVPDSIELGNRSLFDQITATSYLNYAAFTPPSNLIKTTLDHWFQTILVLEPEPISYGLIKEIV